MGTRIRVAVCTNREAAGAAECLAALAAQVPPDELVVVTSGLPEPAVNAHREASKATVLADPLPGLSRARNRALAWAAADAQADAIAFVDDDAVVADGWREALQKRWDEAPERVACIGGPIRPRYEVPPPAWLSDGISFTLTLLDRGPEVRDLDPEIEAVYGANISFRVEPLERIGGFDPSLGHGADGRAIYFAEEDEAQRALARLGFTIRYVPDAAVWHVIGPERLTRGSFLRRRFAFGRALGSRGGRPWPLAARQAIVSGAGAVAATARGDQARAMERAVRAAENTGVLATAPRRRRAPGRGPDSRPQRP
jgi:glucosyl-dolichyl phosphate glucuronosyltransferase